MYHPTTRVLTVLELLQSRAALNGAELADRLDVDRRTVRRYINMLQELGVPVESEPGRYGGYRLRRGYKLPPMMFTEEEALMITLGLVITRRMGITQAAPAVEGALAKLDRVLPDRLRGRVQAVQGALAFTPMRGMQHPSDAATVLALTAAAQGNQRVWLRYRSGEEETERVIDPYGIVNHQGRWYAVGWCHLREDVRMFRLDRILALAPREGEEFVRPLDFDPVQFVLESLAHMPWGWPIEVHLDISLEEAKRRVPADFGILEPTPRGVLLRTQADDLDWFARMLIQIGCGFRVLHPPELRQALVDKAREVSRMARRSTQPRGGARERTPRAASALAASA
ncbi:MAG: YafY family transcriptional regulator [Chloroflexi bacterium]|nr:YafY family transcriptional regulator [Chloroflexota bacterium]